MTECRGNYRCSEVEVWGNPYHCDRLGLGQCMPCMLAKPRYPLPAIPLQVEYVHGSGLADGVFIRENGYIVRGVHADGMTY
jgi:hypothetical protein